ncbi:N-6 DNA methylase [Micrococcales bacterium 31B]|nr:N-6 DNA methylase [Micrococcales bacterium 31B]
MATFDSLVVIDDFVSEHYFTVDATTESLAAEVKKLRKQWSADEKEGVGSARSRFVAQRAALEAALASLEPPEEEAPDTQAPDEAAQAPNNPANPPAPAPVGREDALELRVRASEAHRLLREALGYAGPLATFTGTRGDDTLRVPQVWLSAGGEVVIVEATPAHDVESMLREVDPLLGASLAEKPLALTPAKLLSEIFQCAEAPAFALVLAGQHVVFAEAERWAEGRYLVVNVLAACARNDVRAGGEIDTLLACLGHDQVVPDAAGTVWWSAIFDASVKHTVGVSKDLREGIRTSIEIIANDVISQREARGLPPLRREQGQPLAREALRFLYRILFLLYAEAQPQMGVVPVGAAEYDRGYGIDRLRELALVPLTESRSRAGRHLYESLHRLFTLVNEGHAPDHLDGLVLENLEADLFSPRATALIDETGLSNAALQRVLQHLLLSKAQKGRDRGFISYAQLGINQLGAVYEGLMSYTGFIAEDDLYEVAKDGNAEKGSWVVPVDRSEHLPDQHFLTYEDEHDGATRRVVHRRGSFVFRLAGRERQQSASYYTPEVLTRFVVQQALEELLDQGGETTTAEQILGLSICEPALGSGAFAIEAVRQLAEEYLRRRQRELGTQVPVDEYVVELQRVKAHIALHQVYGVDLNATAVELAEISLWLDTMVKGLRAPWFGLRLRRGNSLIGARRATYSVAQLGDRSYYATTPTERPLTSLAESLRTGLDDPSLADAVHHFLVPGEGWGAAADSKGAKEFAPEAAKALKAWRSKVHAKLTAAQVARVKGLARRTEVLWKFALRRLQIAEAESSRFIDFFGRPESLGSSASTVTRAQIEAALADMNGPYQRLRLVMDAWCSLWFWPVVPPREVGGVVVDDSPAPPTLDQWLNALEMILGAEQFGDDSGRARNRHAASGNIFTLNLTSGWGDLATAEGLDREFSGQRSVDEIFRTHAWLATSQTIAGRQGFFHWNLDFATVFARGGGFDLQVGNPPWVRPDSAEDAWLAEFDPWWQLVVKPPTAERKRRREAVLASPEARAFVAESYVSIDCLSNALGSVALYPWLEGLRTDLYRCFMEHTWRNNAERGIVSLIHPESHFTEKKANRLRGETYRRLRRHWQFVNELTLFEITHHVSFGVHVYGAPRVPSFLASASLYHPETIARSFHHDGSGAAPGMKAPTGGWDTRPHAERIIHVDETMLKSWAMLLEDPESDPLETRIVYPVNRASAHVLEKLAVAPRASVLELEFSSGWNEKTDRDKGRFDVGSHRNSAWQDVILQGPHFSVATPFTKEPNASMKNNLDYSELDLEALPPNFIPRTSYQPAIDLAEYRRLYTQWGPADDRRPALDFYRIAWRAMAATTGVRTLISAILPPGAAHINGVLTFGGQEIPTLLELAGVWASIPADFVVKVSGVANLHQSIAQGFPKAPSAHPLLSRLRCLSARLNCLTDAYADLWNEAFTDDWTTFDWAAPRRHNRLSRLGDITPEWTPACPLRIDEERRQALVELDVITAIMLGIDVDELCTIYRTQFPVLHGYERSRDLYDANGRLVPNEVAKAYHVALAQQGLHHGAPFNPDPSAENPAPPLPHMSYSSRTTSNAQGNEYTYELPFTTRDRELDFRASRIHL